MADRDLGQGERLLLAAQIEANADIIELLRQTAAEVNKEMKALEIKEGPGAIMRRDQLADTLEAIHTILHTYYENVSKTVEAQREQAALAAVEHSYEASQVLLRSGLSKRDIKNLKESSKQAAVTNLLSAVNRKGGAAHPLSTRVWKTEMYTRKVLDNRINTGLARGLSARQLAKSVAEFVNPFTPGGVKYASTRLARTEINNAFHNTTIQEADRQPWVQGFIWTLSNSHPAYDICDEYAKQSPWSKEDVPDKPHPHCLCTLILELQDEDDFMDQLLDGKYDKALDSADTPEPIKVEKPEGVKRTLKEAAEMLTEKEDEARLLYAKGKTFFDVRDAYTSGLPYFMEDGQNIFDVLDRTIEKTVVPDTKLYRAMRVPKEWLDNLEDGSVIENRFYVSTTTDIYKAQALGAQKAPGTVEVVMEIDNDSGVNGMAGFASLKEWVLPPTTKFEVRKIHEQAPEDYGGIEGFMSEKYKIEVRIVNDD